MFSSALGRKPLLAVVAVAASATLATVSPATAAPLAPAGNNGTVKIDGQPFDTHPDNQPHVACPFQVDFYGFDLNSPNAKVVFTSQPPSGKAVTLLTDSVYIGEDAAGGGTDLDAQPTYNFAGRLGQLKPHPKQGYHVKLTVTIPLGGGKTGTKHKVFWVKDCKCPY